MSNSKNRTLEIEIPASPFMEELDRGTGITVYMLKRSKLNLNESPWAIKKINKNLKKSLFEKRLNDEAKILRQLDHPNIVGFRNFSKNPKGESCLAMEVCDQSLGNLIEERAEDECGIFPADKIELVAKDIANGLNYLHEKLILHGDIKSFNVLVKNEFEVCKLCDFGCSRVLNNKGVLSRKGQFVGTGPWKPPEAFSDNGVITTKSDMFSYGLVLWEMMALQIPHCEMSENSDLTLDNSVSFNDESLTENYGTRPAIPDDVKITSDYQYVLEIFYMCTIEDPIVRCSARQIVEYIKRQQAADQV